MPHDDGWREAEDNLTTSARSLTGSHKESRMDQETLGFPLWLRINHVINLF